MSGRTYVAYDNGTALDTETNLLWMRCSVGQKWNGKICTGEAELFDWETAKQQTANFAGYSDWRIPMIEELRTLVYCSSGKPAYFNPDPDPVSGHLETTFICGSDGASPCIVQSVFPYTPSHWFWAGSPGAWAVLFSDGYDKYGSTLSNYKHVRLVRGGQ